MDRFYRTKLEKKIFGVCGGLSKYTDTDPFIWRLIFVGLIFTSFPIITLYLIASIVSKSE